MIKDVPDYSPPEEFVSAPLLCMVPIVGDVTRLEGFTTSLYARYEKISLIVSEMERAPQVSAVGRFNAEREMLREILDWLAITPE
jgi:hypothetical protein